MNYAVSSSQCDESHYAAAIARGHYVPCDTCARRQLEEAVDEVTAGKDRFPASLWGRFHYDLMIGFGSYAPVRQGENGPLRRFRNRASGRWGLEPPVVAQSPPVRRTPAVGRIAARRGMSWVEVEGHVLPGSRFVVPDSEAWNVDKDQQYVLLASRDDEAAVPVA